MDFFNRKITATVGQRLRHLTLLMETLGKQDNVKLQLIRRGFSDDFQHITNPCVFLSDTTGYLRLENGEYEDDILLINGVQNREHFDRFFEKIWHGSADVSYSDKEAVSAFARSQIEALNMLNLLENGPGTREDRSAAARHEGPGKNEKNFAPPPGLDPAEGVCVRGLAGMNSRMNDESHSVKKRHFASFASSRA
jgi:hypothetical protein